MTAYGDGFVAGYLSASGDPLEILVKRHLALAGIRPTFARVSWAVIIIRRCYAARVGDADTLDLSASLDLSPPEPQTVAQAIAAWELQGLIDGLVHRAMTIQRAALRAQRLQEAKQREIATTA